MLYACRWDDAHAAEVRRQGELEVALQRQMVLQKQLQDQLEVIAAMRLLSTICCSGVQTWEGPSWASSGRPHKIIRLKPAASCGGFGAQRI